MDIGLQIKKFREQQKISQVENIRLELKQLLEIITNKDAEGMKKYLTKIREKIK